ncbi:TPA: hypothetical protein UL242_002498 [Clostridioides difficile]|uniref:Uncharacterized protein n=1 Tax=Clostridioides difficile TaxID=1496 RepID=A0AAN5VLJ0_CLODI|nr:hypothetical protein [Clostridioides difficile]EGT3943975.1 hypothetical protein [Clostridioides difficile]MBG0198733.1 hypothetical protein [Clostridioides difficile]MBH7847208.1 hypothetical protein [Clostridioides difficile]MBY1662047.1 hypothetical protein [Clostridioides difficile]MCA0574579.1 hypothetical protein [Clostridioides difficile]
MKLNLNELRLLISDKENDLYNKRRELLDNSIVIKHSTFIQGKNELTQMTPEYSFDEELNEYNEMTEDVVKYKNLLQNTNNKTKISDEDTISSALTKLKEYRNYLSVLDKLSSLDKEKKHRKVDTQYASSFYMEIKTLNFDRDNMIERKNELRKKINTLESLISKMNSDTYLEI